MSAEYAQLYRDKDFRRHPELYRIGRGEQGVLLAEPYKSELLPHWRFRTPQLAQQSAEKIYSIYQQYQSQGDFVGMDMARKFLQMGYTRSRRYANHRSGQKYKGAVPLEHRGESGAWGRPLLTQQPDPQKAASAAIFLAYYLRVIEDPNYQQMKTQHKKIQEV